jgi:O-methyltransferase
MKKITNIWRALFKKKPIINKLSYLFFRPFQFSTSISYNFSDEKLKFMHLLEAVNYTRVALLPQVYMEFGCHSARTFSAAVNAAKYLNMDEMNFYAFDSFMGLPKTNEEVDGVFESGEFKTSMNEFRNELRKQTGAELPYSNIIPGYFSDSLTLELQTQMPKVGVVHIDVDLYSSTIEVLNFIKPLLVVGSVLIFDDYYCFPPDGSKGEMKALLEFCEDNPEIKVKEWKSYSTFGQSFFITSI